MLQPCHIRVTFDWVPVHKGTIDNDPTDKTGKLAYVRQHLQTNFRKLVRIFFGRWLERKMRKVGSLIT